MEMYDDNTEAKWQPVYGLFTPGGDPMYECPICKSEKSRHLNGVEFPNELEHCPNCGTPLTY